MLSSHDIQRFQLQVNGILTVEQNSNDSLSLSNISPSSLPFVAPSPLSFFPFLSLQVKASTTTMPCSLATAYKSLPPPPRRLSTITGKRTCRPKYTLYHLGFYFSINNLIQFLLDPKLLPFSLLPILLICGVPCFS